MEMEFFSLPVAVAHFLAYFGSSLGLMSLFIFIYIRFTSFAEFKLIKEGNMAASLTLAGAMIGYAIPLSKAVQQSLGAADLLIWALAGLIAQVLGLWLVEKLIPKISEKVAGNSMSHAIFMAAVSISVGLINAASMTE